jgi:threonine aldolase
MDFIDLRSDTVTKPTPEMREAMAKAEVGDDVFMEDPTINRLQDLAAARMGKEAGLFVASGTMGNLLGVLAHCGRGDEAIVGNLGHTFLFEAGGISALGGVHPYVLQNQPDGTLKLEDIHNAIRAVDVHAPPSRLVILENTHNRCGGVPLTEAYTQQVCELAHDRGLQVHLDGARIFHAAVALGVDVSELTRPVDSVTFCLSKGLCAPVGSVLCGTRAFIDKARHLRKQVGGGMRQAGILAAAGIIALEKMSARLGEDHQRARILASGLSAIPGIILDNGSPYTNMIFLSLANSIDLTAVDVAAELAAQGIKVQVIGPRRFRLVVHYWVGDAEVDKTVQAFRRVIVG